MNKLRKDKLFSMITKACKQLLQKVKLAEVKTIQLEGEYKCWYSNGQLFQHCFYKNGKLDGEFKLWRIDGELAQHCLYKNGARQE